VEEVLPDLTWITTDISKSFQNKNRWSRNQIRKGRNNELGHLTIRKKKRTG